MVKGKNNTAFKPAPEESAAGKDLFFAHRGSRNVTRKIAEFEYLFACIFFFFLGTALLNVTFPAVDNFPEPGASFPQALCVEWITLFPFALCCLLPPSRPVLWVLSLGLGYLTGFRVQALGGLEAALSPSLLIILLRLIPVGISSVSAGRGRRVRWSYAMLVVLSGFLSAGIKFILTM